jgi:uncharacterized protein YcnI
MPSTNATRRLVLGVVLGAVLALPTFLFAHAVVFPRESTPGAYEKYVLRVPNEKSVPTTKVELRFPSEVRVVSFGDVAGWTLDVQTDSAQRVVGAIWSGTLPPQRFVELPFVAVNPRTDARLVWPAYQTYADGERVAWTGPEDAKTPASATVIQSGSARSGSGASSAALWVGIAGLALSLVSLGLVLRRQSETERAP